MAMASFWDRVATTLDLPLLGWPTTANTGFWFIMRYSRCDTGYPAAPVAGQYWQSRRAGVRCSAARAGPGVPPVPGWHRLPVAEWSLWWHPASVRGPDPGSHVVLR